MKIDVVPLPGMLTDEHVRDRAVVVFDVLRATTTIAAALANGAKEIRVFDSLDAARSAASAFAGSKLLCGESNCLPPAGFDLGNSPAAYAPELVSGKTLFLSTTNGTRALVAARKADLLLTGALVNARSVAAALKKQARDVTLLCAGTNGNDAPEDRLGCGAVLSHLVDAKGTILSANAGAELASFQLLQPQLILELRRTEGGQNVIATGLADDIRFAAQADRFDIVPRCDGYAMAIRPMAIA